MNNSQEEKPENELLLTFADLVAVIIKNKRKIYKSAILFAVLALCYGLTKPVQYEAEATFKEKGKSQSRLGSSLTAAFSMVSDSGDSNAMTILRSRKLMEDLIKEIGLQGAIVKNSTEFPLIPFRNIKNNLLIEYGLFRNARTPILSDPQIDFKLSGVVYHNETPAGFGLKVISKDKYVIYDASDKSSEEVFFGNTFSKNGISFTITQANLIPVTSGEYSLVLLPLKQTAESLVKSFLIEFDKNDKNLLKISYKHPNRHQAAANINSLMDLYQRHIQCEHKNICETQVNYLNTKQAEMGEVLKSMLKTHADNLSSDLTSTGFASSDKAMEFSASTLYELKQKLFTINLEIQRLQKIESRGFIENDIFSSISHLDTLNKLSTEKRFLKQQVDSLNLVLRNIPSHSEEFKETFSLQLKDLEEIKGAVRDSQLALASIENNEIPKLYPRLADNSQYAYRNWHERLVEAKDKVDNKPYEKSCRANWKQCKMSFTTYLTQLNHYLNVYQKSIEERLTNQQAPLKEFQGINLNIAAELYVAYNKDLNNVESSSRQYDFIVSQLDDPNFEISPLSIILTDPSSLEMIGKTSALILALKDQDNRSSKEQERLNAELTILKSSLKTHILQSIALLDLRQTFLKEKIQRLQSVNLSLIQEQISILDNQINEFISSTIENLKQEKELIENNLAEIRIEMASLPQKWATEQLINQQMQINKSLVEEVSKLVESKNISNNLEKLQSAPIDLAFPPLQPKPPRLVILTILGAIAGAFFSFVWILGSSVVNGVQASNSNLIAAGQFVCGSLSRSYNDSFEKDPLLDGDLTTLRRLISFMESQKESSNTLLLLEGNGPNYSSQLTELMAFKGLKTLIIDLHFEESQEAKVPGVLQYLEGKVEKPTILHLNGYDKIETGGICRYANELVGSKRFQDLIASVQKNYDWILISSSASPTAAEGESLIEIFPFAAISIADESIQDLKSIIQDVNDKVKKIAFIMTS